MFKKIIGIWIQMQMSQNLCMKHRHTFEHNCSFIDNSALEKLKETLMDQECKPEKIRRI